MRLRRHLLQINAISSTPEAARWLLRAFAIVLSIGILSGVYNFLLFTFNNDLSQRRGYMSSAIAEAHTFFTNRQVLLESLSLTALRTSAQSVPQSPTPGDEETHLLLSSDPAHAWSLWMTRRLEDYLREKQVSLLYVNTGERPQIKRLYNAAAQTPVIPSDILDQLRALESRNAPVNELWLSGRTGLRAHLYLFTRLDEHDAQAGWLGLEIDSHEVSTALSDQSAGTFLMVTADGMQVFSNSPAPDQQMCRPGNDGFFGFIGNGLLPERLVIRKDLTSSEWQLVYSIDLQSVLRGLWKQLLGSMVFCLLSLNLILLLTRRFEQRLIIPAIQRIQALVESEAFSRDVIQTAPVALCVLRRNDGQVVLENHLAQQWLGMGPARDLMGMSWVREAFMPTGRKGDDHVTVDGRHLCLSRATTRYKGEDVLLCAFSDISTRKQVEATLIEARRSADAANEAKTLFLATMSHEIRTPLYGVLGTLELLSRTRLDARQTEYLQVLEGASATLLQLICDVLDVSKIEANQLTLELSEFSPLELTQDVIHAYSAAAMSKGLQLYACLDPQLPKRLIGDVNRIRQVLNNLLGNALKFTDCGRVVLRVRATHLEGDHSELLWQVCDTGKGIAEDDQPLIFQPFYQTQGNQFAIAGSGLGLPICQRLTQLMHGQMRLVSERGLGTSVSLTLPLEVVASTGSTTLPRNLLAEPVYIVSPIRELAQTLSGWLHRWGARPHIGPPPDTAMLHGQLLLELHPGPLRRRLVEDWHGPQILASADGRSERLPEDRVWHVNLNNLTALHEVISQAQGLGGIRKDAQNHDSDMRRLDLRVLVAEDNAVNRTILKDQLEALGCSVELAADGEQALGRWQPGRFDVVLTDVNMPGLDGYALTKALHQRDKTLPIIGATANAMRGELERCLAAGMNHCLVKPFTLLDLYNCLAPYHGNRCDAL
ncbi:response regulator [Pseudomonas sp. CCM 7893]|uniref:histidine kinase n=1 Tax=Pseudomonas spelaei TaxID=1055469 RepID=A0A6I3WJA7_9PSED|nr:response regulator [Pseudomonas spelaei]MUF06486.1 response regulator [Pseudomonas spelaei]